MMNMEHDAQLASLDLNLLVVLDTLFAERHVTRAAKRLGVTQSACSHALGRLRQVFDDPLLVRGPKGAMLLTERAEALSPRLRAALAGLATAIRGDARFDPKTARRSFRIATGDYAELVLMPPLLARLSREAPGIDLWVVPLPGTPEEVVAQLASGEADVAIGPRRRDWPGGIYERTLFEEHFRCIVRKGHPVTRSRLTLARYCALPHLLVAPRGTRGGFVDDVLAGLGRSRRVAVAVPHFLVAPYLVARSDLVATLGSRVIDTYAAPLGLEVLTPPIQLSTFTISMTWHERAHHDEAQRWLREAIVKAAAQ